MAYCFERTKNALRARVSRCFGSWGLRVSTSRCALFERKAGSFRDCGSLARRSCPRPDTWRIGRTSGASECVTAAMGGKMAARDRIQSGADHVKAFVTGGAIRQRQRRHPYHQAQQDVPDSTLCETHQIPSQLCDEYQREAFRLNGMPDWVTRRRGERYEAHPASFWLALRSSVWILSGSDYAPHPAAAHLELDLFVPAPG
jgi:hypothetical protein